MAAPISSTKIFWEEEEWDRLAEILFPLYLNEFETPFNQLWARAMAQFPEGRRRPLVAFAALQPLIGRMLAKSQELQRLAAEASALKQQAHAHLEPHEAYQKYGTQVLAYLGEQGVAALAEQVGWEQLLAAVPDEQLLVMVARRMSSLTGIVVAQAQQLEAAQGQLTRIEQLLARINPTTKLAPAALVPPPPPPPVEKRLPVVVIAGPKGQQITELEKALSGTCQLRIVDKDKNDAIPTSGELYVSWVKFVSHSYDKAMELIAEKREAKFRRHNGGIETMVELIQKSLR